MLHVTFRSYARNGEDIVLWRALSGVPDGRYVDAGATGPTTGSVTSGLAERGWKGVEIRRGAVLDRPLGDVLAEQGLLGEVIHVLALDADGDEASALSTLDLGRVRPVVLLIRAEPPRASGTPEPGWEPAVLDAGYRMRLFTGLFRVDVASEYDDSFGAALSYPACVLDDATRAPASGSADDRLGRAEADAIRWRALALKRWDEAANGSTPTSAGWEVATLRRELDAMRSTVSWRITRPVRAVRRRLTGSAVRRVAASLRGGR